MRFVGAKTAREFWNGYESGPLAGQSSSAPEVVCVQPTLAATLTGADELDRLAKTACSPRRTQSTCSEHDRLVLNMIELARTRLTGPQRPNSMTSLKISPDTHESPASGASWKEGYPEVVVTPRNPTRPTKWPEAGLPYNPNLACQPPRAIGCEPGNTAPATGDRSIHTHIPLCALGALLSCLCSLSVHQTPRGLHRPIILVCLPMKRSGALMLGGDLERGWLSSRARIDDMCIVVRRTHGTLPKEKDMQVSEERAAGCVAQLLYATGLAWWVMFTLACCCGGIGGV